MFRKTFVVVMALGTIGVASACVGPVGKGEGDSCSTNNDCGSDLTCQPIGDGGDYCCPTPHNNSKKASCQAPDGS